MPDLTRKGGSSTRGGGLIISSSYGQVMGSGITDTASIIQFGGKTSATIMLKIKE